jgi:hypothetical protein
MRPPDGLIEAFGPKRIALRPDLPAYRDSSSSSKLSLMDGDTPEAVSRKLLRQAAAIVDVSEATAARALSGFPVRGNTRARLLRALVSLGADVSQVPGELVTGTVDLDDPDLRRGGGR